MAANQVLKKYFCSSNIKIPAGVRYIEVNPIYATNSVISAMRSGAGTNVFIKNSEGYIGSIGENAVGQQGLGNITSPISTVSPVTSNLAYKLLTSGGSSFLIDKKGSLFSTGLNTRGQLGTGDVVTKSSFTSVLGSLKYANIFTYPSNDPNAISVYGISDKCLLYSWGYNSYGQLGVGDVIPRSSPVAVLGGISTLNFSCGSNTAFLIGFDGNAYAWGINLQGQLGVGDSTSRSSPVLVAGNKTWSKILSDGNATLGLDMDGNAYGWGYNFHGQLGNGPAISKSSPVAVLGGIKFKNIYMSGGGSANFSLGLTEEGVAYSWGINIAGNLGVGDVIPRSSPVVVLGNIKFKELYPIGYSTYGISDSGDLYAWGSNTNGQLGVGDVISRSTPTLISSGIKWQEMFTLNDLGFSVGSAYGLACDGQLYSWGLNSYGQLGLGDTTPRSTPVAVLGGSAAITPSFTGTSGIKVSGTSLKIKVTPGNTYALKIGDSFSFFDSIPIGFGTIKRIEISYYM